MNKLFIFLLFCLFFLVFFLFSLDLIYYPSDIKNLFPINHDAVSSIPHNTLVFDAFSQFEPWRHIVKERILIGEFPLWNELNGFGVPLFANIQSAVLFPLNFLYYIFPLGISLNLIPLLKIFLLFSFSYLFLKNLGINKNNSLIGSFVISSSGFISTWLLWPHTNVFIFLPLILFITDKIKTNNLTRFRWFTLLSIIYCIAIFGGHLETLKDIMLLHCLYIFFRFGFHIKELLGVAIFILLGILLASIQLFPFLEYLFNSNAYLTRVFTSYSYLPFSFSILNIIPFILGAPHLLFYKPISVLSNFQEGIGGYTGIIVLITSIIGSFGLYKRNNNVKFWTLVTLGFFLTAYNIWPFGMFLRLPILSQSQNSRLIALTGFGLAIIFSYTLQYLNLNLIYKQKIIGKVLFILIFPAAFIFFRPLILLQILNYDFHPFLPLLLSHITFIVTTTISFFLFLIYIKPKVSKNTATFIIIVLIGFQTSYLFYNYIPLLNKIEFYPGNSVISKLQKMPKGAVLEIGNPSIPPNTNLMYRISSAQSYDALDVRWYKEEFDKAFPIKNQWDKVDEAKNESLKRFGIEYIISDYNINDNHQDVQVKYNSLSDLFDPKKKIQISFQPSGKLLTGIRILPANYNRKNSCTLLMVLLDSDGGELTNKKIKCQDMLDKMYHTVSIDNLPVEPSKKYTILFQSLDASPHNGIGLWGKNASPYIKLFFKSDKNKYEVLNKENDVWFFRVPGVNRIDLDGSYKILEDSSTSLLIQYTSNSNNSIKIKKTYYPGWKAKIDGKVAELIRNGPFMEINTAKGEHVLKVFYEPISFITGSITSFISIVLLMIYVLRSESQMKWWKDLSIKYRKNAKLFLRHSIEKMLFTITVFILLGILISLGLILKIPKFFGSGYSSTINWLSVNNHSLIRDYLTFIIFAIIISASTILGWIFLLWKKNK